MVSFFFFQAEDGIRDLTVTGVQTCALPILSCHTTVAWLPVRIVDHTQVIGTCVSCHNGQIATGKPPTHVATRAGCESCHTTNAWTPARFAHAAVAAHSCAPCTNGVTATGKPCT